MATFNGDKFIKVQLASILKQLSETDEIIISDDRRLRSLGYVVVFNIVLHGVWMKSMLCPTSDRCRFDTWKVQGALDFHDNFYAFFNMSDVGH